MPSLDYEFLKKICPLIVVTSKSNDEEYCEEIKDALCEFIIQLREKEEASADVKIKMATYFFDDEVTGSFDELKPLEEITSDDFDYIETQKSTFDLAKVLDKLNVKLSRKSLFTDKIGYKYPIILFFIDGKNKYEYTGLQNIKNNKWFQNSIKVAILANEYSKTTLDIFTEVVGDLEGVFNIADISHLLDFIVPVSIPSGSIISTDSLWRENLVREDPVIVDDEVKCDIHFEVALKSGSVSINKRTTIQLCQVMACLPEKAMDTAFVLTPQNGFVNVEFGTEAVCEIFIDVGETIEIANCSGREISFGLNAENLSVCVDNDNNSIKFSNSSWGDSTVRVPVSVGEKMLLKDKDKILDTNNCLLVEIKADSYENTCPGEIVWDDDGFNDGGWD